ncbi:MAG: CorA family divalent cation transporter [Rhodospirillales bacterium]
MSISWRRTRSSWCRSIWIDEKRAITLRDRDHALSALRDIRIALQGSRGPRKAGGLLVQICEKIVRDTAPGVEDMDEEVERLEDAMVGSASKELRRSLAELRRRAVHLRRFLGPQREALIRLQTEDTRLLDRNDRMRLRCTIDSVIRYLEDMDALRDRTTILHEDLAAQISEKIAVTSNRLTAVAALLLPPSLVAGMLGANIGGIPGPEESLGLLGDEPRDAGANAGPVADPEAYRLAVGRPAVLIMDAVCRHASNSQGGRRVG